MDMTSKTIILSFLILFRLQSFGQNDDQYADKSFLIIASTKNIDESFSIAKTASQKTGLNFRDNKLQADKLIGATFPSDTCAVNGFTFPCYVARGRFDDGSYLSVEYSDGYTGFQKGLYIVIAASGDKNGSDFKNVFKKVQRTYPKSYIKQTKVFLGCIH
jgi:hypothetical protein